MINFLNLIILILNLSVNGQSKEAQLIQMSIDFPVLQNHLDSQEVINTSRVNYIRDNGIVNNNLSLTYKSDSLKFNNGQGKEGFINYWTFEFTNVKVKSKKANVTYKFIPTWNYCQEKSILSQSGKLFFVVKLDFRLTKNGWAVVDYLINDINFEQHAKDSSIKCLKEMYKPIN